jgi:hypothetical protein
VDLQVSDHPKYTEETTKLADRWHYWGVVPAQGNHFYTRPRSFL